MPDIGWDEAIKRVLSAADEAMHYKSIAEEVANQGYRKSLGATPASTVNAYITTSINNDGDDSPYIRTGRGYYFLKENSQNTPQDPANSELIEDRQTGLIQCLGMFWHASAVNWKSNPKVLGQEQSGSDTIDFCEQVGVYLLHDRSRVVYVGRSNERPMGQRLFEHTKDRLNGRGDRFSWLGLRAVNESGRLADIELNANDESSVINTLEAVLIETLEPPQNRRRGDGLAAAEYLQVEDPEKDRAKRDALQALMRI